MYSPHWRWKSESHYGGADDSCDVEWSYEARSQLPCAPPDRNFLGGEPHALPDLISWSWYSSCCFIRVEALMRLACVALQVLLQRLTNSHADGTPTSSSWLVNNGGWYPRQHSNGDLPDAADVWLLIALIAAYGNCEPNCEAGLLAQRHRRTVSIDWFAPSVWPLDWGWKPDERLTDVPNNVQNALQNWGPLSETISVGMPWIITMCVIRSCAVSDAEGNLVSGTKWKTCLQ